MSYAISISFNPSKRPLLSKSESSLGFPRKVSFLFRFLAQKRLLKFTNRMKSAFSWLLRRSAELFPGAFCCVALKTQFLYGIQIRFSLLHLPKIPRHCVRHNRQIEQVFTLRRNNYPPYKWTSRSQSWCATLSFKFLLLYWI